MLCKLYNTWNANGEILTSHEMKNMNICVISRAVPVHSIGGMELNTLLLSRVLVCLGHNVTILTTSFPTQINNNYIDNIDNVKIYYVGGCRSGKYSNRWGESCVYIFEDLHRRKPFDIVHGHNSAGLYLHRSGILKKYRLPLVTTYHSTHLDWIASNFSTALRLRKINQIFYLLSDAAVDLYRLLFNDIWLARASDALIAIDDQAVRKMHLQYFVSRDKIHRIYTSIDTNLFSPNNRSDIRRRFNINKDQILLLTLGRLVPEKGFQIAITAIPELAKIFPNIHLFIVGNGPYRKELEELAKKLNVFTHVTFVGSIDHQECPFYFNACDVFINPIVHMGGYPTTLIEAMACEKVVITSKNGGTSTLIKNGENGILIKQGSVRELAEAVMRILQDTERAKIIGKSARKLVIEKFSVEVMARSTIHCYLNLLRNTTIDKIRNKRKKDV